MPIIRDEYNFKQALQLLKEKSGRDIPLSITEYNGGFRQQEPVPYRHSLGTALVNADLLRLFMKLEHNILMANYWQFCNNYWGMIANGFDGTYKTLYNPYYKRPNYYVFELYAKHFGDMLIESEVKCDSYDIGQYKSLEKFVSEVDITRIPYLSVNASKSSDGNKVYLMVINKNMDEGITTTIDLKDFTPDEEINAWILNGSSIDAINEKDHNNVKITHKKIKTTGNPFEFTFEPHSLTAIEIEHAKEQANISEVSFLQMEKSSA
jgi:alpha-L-arabinofuranosidase